MSFQSSKVVDLVAEVGATLIFQHVVAGTPDLSTGAAKMQVRRELGADPLLELTDTATADGSITLGASGEIDIRVEGSFDWVPPDETGPIAFERRFVYDLFVTLAGDTTRHLEGVVIVRPSVTAPPP